MRNAELLVEQINGIIEEWIGNQGKDCARRGMTEKNRK
jgi:hypothetical protein